MPHSTSCRDQATAARGSSAGLEADAARLLFARPAAFLRGVTAIDQLPPGRAPEVGFAGRSNVGKSSLINALTGQSRLARTSNTPGRTQELNFFDLSGRLVLVDLPGYGYAQAPKAKVDAWTDLVFAFLKGRPNLMRVCLLVDARHGPKPSDEAAMAVMGEAAVPFQLVLTKADLVKPPALRRLVEEVEAALRRRAAALPEVVVTSARRREGLDALRDALAGLAASEPSEVLP